MSFSFAPHTVVINIGPSCCGKSTWSGAIRDQAEAAGVRAPFVISSDDIRASMLPVGALPQGRKSATMLAYSEQAFAMLFAMLDAATTYPVNSELIIIDTTGLDENFRHKVRDAARAVGYNVVLALFDLSYGDLDKLAVDADHPDAYLTKKHQERLRKEVLPNLQRKTYDDVIKIESIEQLDTSQYTFDRTIDRCELVVGENEPVAVIGDVHECVEELKELIAAIDKQDIRRIVFCGDWIDKGNATTEIVQYMVDLIAERGVENIRIVNGNHERYVFRRLAGEFPANPGIESTFFTGISALQAASEEQVASAKVLYALGTPFVHIRGEDWLRRSVYVTHAPVDQRFIGKVTPDAVRAQANFMFKDRSELAMSEELKFIEKQSRNNFPWHVFGHVAHNNGTPHIHGNSIWLDTGCVHGGSLSAVIFRGMHHRKPETISIKARSVRCPTTLYPAKRVVPVEEKLLAEFVELDPKEERRVRAVIRGGAKYVSGTMAPAASAGLDIESLESGLKAFAERNNVTEVVLQPKYMGSRAQVYLIKTEDGLLDIENSFATSRNGFRIDKDTSAPVFQPLFDAYQHLFARELVIDGELCPWAALGSGLIDTHFNQYKAMVDHQLTLLEADPVFAQFEIGKTFNVSTKREHYTAFAQQLDIYGAESDTVFKPFSILLLDDRWMGDADQWTVFNDMLGVTTGLLLDITTPDALEKATAYFNTITTEQKMEGVVLKPRVFTEGVLPYMKVRSKDYLRIVYGYDYPDRLERLCRQKSVVGKSRHSIKEYHLGRVMAQNPELRTKAIYAIFGAIVQERGFDPRL